MQRPDPASRWVLAIDSSAVRTELAERLVSNSGGVLEVCSSRSPEARRWFEAVFGVGASLAPALFEVGEEALRG